MSSHSQTMSYGQTGKMVNLYYYIDFRNSTQKAVFYHLKLVICVYYKITVHGLAPLAELMVVNNLLL